MSKIPTVNIDLTYTDTIEPEAWPSQDQLTAWLHTAWHVLLSDSAYFSNKLKTLDLATDLEISIRITDSIEIAKLNHTYRQKAGPTNVLSFPYVHQAFAKQALTHHFLGDIILCAQIIQQESDQQHKPSAAHWAHICIHGFLHLLGYDHETSSEAEHMEDIETHILKQLGYDDPYTDLQCNAKKLTTTD